ncbi:MAG: hypothetical protein GC168_13160 [Candidatus Hydrogenedens sp.]|nr:hypothetical protein [Candidatus Hydrogenedens sp.]
MSTPHESENARGNVHGDETRHAIILAAIRVIAEQGVSGASLRAINVAAGCRNSSASHYHFGTKLAVIDAALSTVYAEVDAGQAPLMSDLELRVSQGRPVGVREVLEAAYLPFLALMTRPDYGPAAAKFFSRILVESDDQLQAVLNRLVAPMMLRCLALLQSALPQVPEPVLRRRLFITVTNVVHGAGDMPAAANSPLGDLTSGNPLEMLHELFDYMTAAISAAPQPLTPADEARMAATLFGQG